MQTDEPNATRPPAGAAAQQHINYRARSFTPRATRRQNPAPMGLRSARKPTGSPRPRNGPHPKPQRLTSGAFSCGAGKCRADGP
eukprot:5206475-Pyramimonas_sp.AAC.1